MVALPAGGLGAGGTLPRHPALAYPALWRRARLVAEMALVFIGAPLAIKYAISELRLPLFFVLQPVFVGLAAYLLWDRTFVLRHELSRGFRLADLLSIIAVFIVGGGIVAVLVAELLPGLFLSMPRHRPSIWLMIIMLYPLLSVMAQELFYRTFYFHRYGPLFGNRRWLAVGVNALLFGFGHLMFGNWIALVGSTVAGVLFAYRYEATRSFWAVWIEHTLWGWLVFTVGLGGFFFTGVGSIPLFRL